MVKVKVCISFQPQGRPSTRFSRICSLPAVPRKGEVFWLWKNYDWIVDCVCYHLREDGTALAEVWCRDQGEPYAEWEDALLMHGFAKATA